MSLWPRFNSVERTCQTPSCEVQISFSGEGEAGFSNCFFKPVRDSNSSAMVLKAAR
jgi:hypothetical protein